MGVSSSRTENGHLVCVVLGCPVKSVKSGVGLRGRAHSQLAGVDHGVPRQTPEKGKRGIP